MEGEFIWAITFFTKRKLMFLVEITKKFESFAFGAPTESTNSSSFSFDFGSSKFFIFWYKNTFEKPPKTIIVAKDDKVFSSNSSEFVFSAPTDTSETNVETSSNKISGNFKIVLSNILNIMIRLHIYWIWP